MWQDWIRLKKELAILGEELPAAELLAAKQKEQSPGPTSKEGRRHRGDQTKSISRVATCLQLFCRVY